jgi:hypothetical protein
MGFEGDLRRSFQPVSASPKDAGLVGSCQAQNGANGQAENT